MSMAEFKGKVKNIQDTPFGYTVSLIGGKWKMVIIYLLAENRTVRFNDLKRQIGAITYKTLSSQLKELEADGLVNRKEYPQVPLKSSTVSQIKQKHYYLFWKGYVSGEQKTKIIKSSFLLKILYAKNCPVFQHCYPKLNSMVNSSDTLFI